MQEIKLEVSEAVLNMLEDWRNERITEYYEMLKGLNEFDHRVSVQTYEKYIVDLEGIGGYKELLERYLMHKESEQGAIRKFDTEGDIRKLNDRSSRLPEKGRDFLLKQLIWYATKNRIESIAYLNKTIEVAEKVYKK